MTLLPEKPWFLAITAASLITAFFLISSYVSSGTTSANRSILCSLSSAYSPSLRQPLPSTALLSAQISKTILHYATAASRPQQSKEEITVSLNVLLRRRPCNFLVFGLGFDSQMWDAFNLGGHTLFLEEDPTWVKVVLTNAQFLNARTVNYRTQLQHSGKYLAGYKTQPTCLPSKAFVKGNSDCALALDALPEEFYQREWDLIMIDAPKGYFPTAPGRMAAIWTAAVMARNRKGDGFTDVFLHDVDRPVEKQFALEFLCKKYLVDAVQRIWHFRIPKFDPNNSTLAASDSFC